MQIDSAKQMQKPAQLEVHVLNNHKNDVVVGCEHCMYVICCIYFMLKHKTGHVWYMVFGTYIELTIYMERINIKINYFVFFYAVEDQNFEVLGRIAFYFIMTAEKFKFILYCSYMPNSN